MKSIQAKIIFAFVLAACAGIPAIAAPTLAVSAQGDGTVNFYKVSVYTAFGGGAMLGPAGSVKVGKRSGELCLAPDQKQLFASTDHDVAIIDVAGKSLVGSLTAPGLSDPDGCTVSPDSKKLYVIDPDARAVFVFDITSRQFLKRVDVGKEPRRVIFTPGGQKVLVSNAQSNTLSVLDPANDTVIDEIKTGVEPRDMAFSPDGKLLAVSLIEDDSIGFFDAGTLQFKRQIGAVLSPQHLEFSPDSSRLYVAGKMSNQLGVVEISSRKIRTLELWPVDHTFAGVGGVWGLAITPDGQNVFVSTWGDDSISIFNVRMNEQTKAYHVGKTPGAMIMIKDTSAVTTMSSSAKLNHFRALAQQAVAAVKAKDYSTGAKLAKSLEQEWDEGSANIRQKSPELWGQIDESMDDFIHPIIHANTNPPSPAELDKAYQNFLSNLNQARR